MTSYGTRVFKRLNNVFEKYERLPSIILKPKQVQCFEYLGEGHHVIVVLPAGTKGRGNIVLVVSPLTSIIQDQLVYLTKVVIECGFLQLEDQANNSQKYKPLFEEDLNDASNSIFKISKSIVAGKCKILFAYPESLLSDQGRKILRSKIEENVVACVRRIVWNYEFQNLSVLQALFRHSIMLALTATALPTKLRNLKKALKIENCKVVTANPNPVNMSIKNGLYCVTSDHKLPSLKNIISSQFFSNKTEPPLFFTSFCMHYMEFGNSSLIAANGLRHKDCEILRHEEYEMPSIRSVTCLIYEHKEYDMLNIRRVTCLIYEKHPKQSSKA
ncbi:uncharacterized protein LOC130648076 [Hydractinia symbiolongicarpus]|uniref:uncharacterized protein LOC130648076 n=1 Tax=Hydractinia symbiolongicarpus TaxID=13093 RepID=UPI00254AD0E8|nr:uncharacterized protein LOC130648076 [Hydractinia symbiolongicarpus]